MESEVLGLESGTQTQTWSLESSVLLVWSQMLGVRSLESEV